MAGLASPDAPPLMKVQLDLTAVPGTAPESLAEQQTCGLSI
jgi:hypothetical protein